MKTPPAAYWSDGAASPMLARDGSWRDAAACAGSGDLFFPEKGRTDQAEAARQVCAGCPVRRQCLGFALENEERHGVWGGLTERERRKVKAGAARALRRCQKGLHVMSRDNITTDGRCRACRLDSDRQSRARKALAA